MRVIPLGRPDTPDDDKTEDFAKPAQEERRRVSFTPQAVL
jgi:hypothetical protein